MFRIVNTLEIGGPSKLLYTIAASIGNLEMLTLILENSLFPCINDIFLNKIFLEIKTFLNFFKLFNSPDIESKAVLLNID